MAFTVIPGLSMATSPLPDLRATFFLAERMQADSVATIQGVILDVPVDDRLDTLAAYIDGSARYINHSGYIVIWEVLEAENRLRPLVDNLLIAASAMHLPNPLRGWKVPRFRGSSSHLTVLTRAGLGSAALGSDPLSEQLFGAGVALMSALIDTVPRG
jgi:hypothetical protein